MFRVKVRVDAGWIASHAELAKPGMPGMAYVQTAPDAVWSAMVPGEISDDRAVARLGGVSLR